MGGGGGVLIVHLWEDPTPGKTTCAPVIFLSRVSAAWLIEITLCTILLLLDKFN